jgi:RES domain
LRTDACSKSKVHQILLNIHNQGNHSARHAIGLKGSTGGGKAQFRFHASGYLSVFSYDDLRPYVYFQVQFPEEFIEISSPQSLPENWRKDPGPPECRQYGDAWLSSQSKPVLKIPTVVLPEGYNFIVNPGHPDFPHIKIGAPKPFILDDRIIRKRIHT